MPVRLLAAAQGQAANSLYWGPLADEYGLIAANLADNRVELSTDYQPNTRTVPSTLATATVSRTALNYAQPPADGLLPHRHGRVDNAARHGANHRRSRDRRHR
jgi:hypothetical protein